MNTAADHVINTQPSDPGKLRDLFDTGQPADSDKSGDTATMLLPEAILLLLSAIASGGSMQRMIGIFAAANIGLCLVRLITSALGTKSESPQGSEQLIDRFTSGFILAVGVVVPSLLVVAYSIFHVPSALRDDPLGTANELAILLCTPLAIWASWYTIAKKRLAYVSISSGAAGLALGLCAALTATWIFQPPLSPLWGTDHTFGLFVLWAPAALLASSLVLNTLLNVQNTKFRRIGACTAMAGIAASGLLTVAPHINEYAIDSKVNTAMTAVGEERDQAISFLKSNCSPAQFALLFAEPGQNHRSAFGRLRLFERPALQFEPYFLLTGKSIQSLYSGDISGDAHVGQQVVGEPVPGLAMTSTNIDGTVNPDTLTGSFDWTMVFRNAAKTPAETRSEIQLPAGAVVSRVTAWINGKPVEATFDRTDKTTNAYQWVVQKHRDPILVTSAGQDRIFVQAYPVPPFGGYLKLRIGIKTPLALAASGRCNVGLPRFSNKNFTPKARQSVNLSATEPFIQPSWSTQALLSDKQNHLHGVLPLSQKGDAPIAVSLEHRRSQNVVATPDPTSHGQNYIVQRVVAQKTDPAQKLVFVIDTSSTLKQCASAIKKTLSTLANDRQASVIFASSLSGNLKNKLGSDDQKSDGQEMLPELSIHEALKEIDTVPFTGGTNNDTAVLQALESAATVSGGTVVWLHGPQPLPPTYTELESLGIFNKPRLVDLQLGSESNALIENWHNYQFNSVASYDHVAIDDQASNLDSLVTSYVSGKQSSLITQELLCKKPDLPISDSPLLAAELSSLWASKAISGLLEQGDTARAERIGTQYHIISPVTGAVALEKKTDYQFNGLQESHFRAAQPKTGPNAGQIAAASLNRVAIATVQDGMPTLSGTTNGTIGAQGADATIVQGINTCGTVRVNNLANLEALFAIGTILFQCIGYIYSAAALFIAYKGRKTNRTKSKRMLVKAITVLTLSLMITPAVNELFATARDANLFS